MVKKEKLLKTAKHVCPSCDSPKYEVINQNRVDIGGLLGDQAYQSILFKRVICQGCQQHTYHKDYVAADEVADEQN